MNLRIDLAYDGAPFHGFARQRDVRTVQGDVENALTKLFGDKGIAPDAEGVGPTAPGGAVVMSVGAGRTDAGVHALGQVMGVAEAPDDLDTIKARDALNGMCAPAICVWQCAAMPSDWHARHSARSRTYIYAVLEGGVPDPWLSRTSLYHPETLDIDAMNEAAGHLVGPHDFASFGRPSETGGSTERNLFELRCLRSGRIVTIRARANAFIQQMVRSLVGTLIQVGEDRRSPEEMLEVLAARDRAAAGPVAEPHGLCLVAVEYDIGWSRPAPV